MARLGLRTTVATAVLLVLAAVPVVALASGNTYYITLFTRIMIFALAALGLNLILGYGGMVSLGHALYVGIGAYSVGILSFHGISSGWAHLGVAFCAGLVVSVPIGLVVLRTGGIAFIMITLAFAQMFYFLAVGLRQYGGDEGLAIGGRSEFGLFSLASNTVLYYVTFAALMIVLFGASRLIASRFGMVLRGCKSNERRMIALGFATLRYKLAAYVMSALVCVVAGMLLANLTRFVSPSYMQWQISGELIVMIVLGGMGTLIGPIVGSASLVLLEEILASVKLGLPWGIDAYINAHLMAVVGIFIVVVALYMKQGLFGLLVARERRS